MARDRVPIGVRRLVFPIVGGTESTHGFRHTAFLGTGFFISSRGLALTAGHVVLNLAAGVDVRAALPPTAGGTGAMLAQSLLWRVALPDSDIAVVRVNVSDSACFATRFIAPVMGHDVETAAIPESMLVRDSAGKTKIQLRVAKGYVSHGDDKSIFASFALPRGMSGAPVIVTEPDAQFVAGVFVGQSRGEQIEDEIVEVADIGAGGTHRHTERVSKVEYFARGDLLAPFNGFTAPEFDGLTLEALIAKHIFG